MASRLLHYLIASELAERQEIKDKNRFCIGALLPDLSGHEDGSYNTAHFWVELEKENKKGINWLLFRDRYAAQMEKDSLYLGYYCHLIMDSIWFCSIADKYIRNYPPEIKKDRYKAGYRDYQRLNYLLGKKYNLRYNIRNISIEEINEVKGELLENFLSALKDDIQCASEAKVEALEIYKLELMEEYINKSAALCESEMAAFFRGEEREQPENYYVNII